MTAQQDEGHTGLDRDANQRADVNPEGKQDGEDPRSSDAMSERWDELTDVDGDR